MKIHKYCKMFPIIDGDDFKRLTLDIKANGLRQPIITLGGAILDGQNRWNACVAAGVPPTFEELNPEVDPLEFVISQNLNRRHLSDDQRAAIAAQIANHKGGNQPESGRLTNADAAAAFKVTKNQVKLAKQVKKESPKAYKEVIAGTKTLNEAHEEKHPRKRRQSAAPDHSPTDAEIDAATSLPPRETSPKPTPADSQSEAGERIVITPEPAPKSLWSAPINTVADALAFCATCEDPAGQWEAAAMMLAQEVEQITAEIKQLKADLDKGKLNGAPDSLFKKPHELLVYLRGVAKRIPQDLPQRGDVSRESFGVAANEMVKWLMNPIVVAGTPSPYTR